jgi:hypothetical protein
MVATPQLAPIFSYMRRRYGAARKCCAMELKPETYAPPRIKLREGIDENVQFLSTLCAISSFKSLGLALERENRAARKYLSTLARLKHANERVVHSMAPYFA